MRNRYITNMIDKKTRQLIKIVNDALEEQKALDILVIDVREISSITDVMMIASGRSDRQVKAIAEKVIQSAKEAGQRPLGIEGLQQGEWILVDLGDVILHVMHPTTRAYYQLEKLWSPNKDLDQTSTT